jgi:hypothetical protein
METHCEGGQGPPRAVMPRKKKKEDQCVLKRWSGGDSADSWVVCYVFVVVGCMTSLKWSLYCSLHCRILSWITVVNITRMLCMTYEWEVSERWCNLEYVWNASQTGMVGARGRNYNKCPLFGIRHRAYEVKKVEGIKVSPPADSVP